MSFRGGLLLLVLASCSSAPKKDSVAPRPPDGNWSDLPDLPPTRAKVRRAARLLQDGQNREAERLLLEILEQSPLYVPAHRLLQNLELAEGHAGKSWARLVQLEKRFGERPSLSYLKLRLAPPRYQGFKRFADELDRFPHSFWLRYGLAWSLFREGHRGVAANQLLLLMKEERIFEPEVYLLAYRIGVRAKMKPLVDRLRGEHPEDGILAALSFLLGSGRASDLLRAVESAFQYKETAQAVMNALLNPRLRQDLLVFLDSRPTLLENLEKSPMAPVIPLLLKMQGRPRRAARFMEGMFTEGGTLSNPIQKEGILWNHLHQRMRELFFQGKGREAISLYRSQFLPLMDLFSPRKGGGKRLEGTTLFGPLLSLLEGKRGIPSPRAGLDLVRSLLQVGWVGEAEALGTYLAGRVPLSPAQEREVKGLLLEARRFLRFRSGLVDLFKGRDAPEDLGQAREALRKLSQDLLGVDVVGRPRTFDFGMLGRLWSPFGPGITEYFWRHGWYLLIGRPIGTRGLSILLARRLGTRRVHPRASLPFEDGVREILLEDKFFSNRMDELLGTLGVALWDHYILDMEKMIQFLPMFEGGDPSILEDPFPRVRPLDMSRPCQVSRKLALRVQERHPKDLFPVLLGSIRTHEQAHLVDSHRMIPLYRNPLRALRLFLDAGMSGEWVRANLEARAEVVDLREGPDPFLSLAWMCTFLDENGGSEDSPHAKGYRRLVLKVLKLWKADGAPGALDPGANLLAQLWRIPEKALKKYARAVARDELDEP